MNMLLKLGKNGHPITRKIKVPLSHLELKLIDNCGVDIEIGDRKPIMTHMFLVRGPGINSNLVKSVKLPKLTYDDACEAIAIVESYVLHGD